jgi:WD40 repeat protein
MKEDRCYAMNNIKINQLNVINKFASLCILFIFFLLSIIFIIQTVAITKVAYIRAGVPQYRLAWNPLNQNVAVIGNKSIVVLTRRLEQLKKRSIASHFGVEEITISLALLGDTNQLVLYAYDYNNVGVWNPNTDTTILLDNANFPVSWSANTNLIATGGNNHTVQIRSGLDFEVEAIFPNFTYSSQQVPDLVHSLDWSENGEYLAARYSSGVIRVWDARTNEIIYVHDGDARSVSWGPGTQMVIVSNNGLELWDVAARKIIGIISAKASLVRWSPAENRLALRIDEGIGLWDIENSVMIWHRKYNDNIISDIQWNAVGTLLVSVDSSGIVTIWDIESGSTIASTQLQ